jgi:pyruvate,orthophosphate dikinase
MNTLYLIGGPDTQELSADIVGSKAANLSRMAKMGLPVPPAFVLPTGLCSGVNHNRHAAEKALDHSLEKGIAFLEECANRRFGDRRRPLLVSARSGAARSMPGMLDSVLNVGCTGDALLGLVRTTGNPRFAWDCRRRFLQGYCETVLGLDPALFVAALAALVNAEQVACDRDLDGEALERFAAECTKLAVQSGAEIPDDALQQLYAAARAVYRSWESEKAKVYRRLQHLEHLEGTAVTVQTMVYGNSGRLSGAGVAFSRDPSAGGNVPVIDLLFDAQGEDVVSGRQNPVTGEDLKRRLPEVWAELTAALSQLEDAFCDVQDVEFTIENKRLWILQTRAAKRTPRAALHIAVDYVREGLITAPEALERLHDLDEERLAITRFSSTIEAAALGVPAAPGVAVGRVAFDSATAERISATGEPVILVRSDTSTADIAGFACAAGILTAAGGRTAHAALVARQMGKPCVVGCTTLTVSKNTRTATIGAATLAEGDWLSLDGDAGRVALGRLDIVTEKPDDDLAELRRWQTMLAQLPEAV